jgi:protein arginine N-methyltransferase 1
MYSIADYGWMIADDTRMQAFARALERAVHPGAVVADIGTGTGIFAWVACRYGARRVYAIEPDAAIQLARDIARDNALDDRIEFIQATSTEVTLPEKADVVISDLGGVLPWFGRHIPSIVDARRRLLAVGGTLLPQRDVAWAAVVEAPDLYVRHAGPWDQRPFGLEMEAARRLAINTWRQCRLTGDALLTPAQRWLRLDYTTVEDPNLCARVEWTVARSGTGHGVAAGFDRTVCDGIELSNAPDAPDAIRPRHIYGWAFFPWSMPVHLTAGDRVTLELQARLVRDDYTWTWRTSVLGDDRREKAHFSQASFLGIPLSASAVQKRAVSYTPRLTEEGRIARLVLESMDSGLSLGEIADRLRAAFPGRFPQRNDALSHVADLADQYG